ncbi:ATP-dependent dethiobiotin synthetase BioD [Aliarcobacter thereius]|uniref:dethiobiotin synthase n=1 Tax=Aliarcobacter thereius TaxID=544718 RepID=UPI000827A578|nr:dethiobiotin synthase [Aliarcobacter thereius]OCL88837.1 ATP-dependent dethiobiotin synthetase BioD [Aliarcobacter thereius]
MNINSKQYIGKAIFVTATNTDVGKTYACEKILNFFAKEGLKVGYFKPIETGVQNNYPLDGSKMLNLAKKLNKDFEHISIDDCVPYQFTLPASPYVAKENSKIDIEFLKEKKEYLQKFCDVLIVEGAGGLMVPIEKDFFMIDLIKEFDCKTFLITPSKLGSINDTLLSIEALKNRKIDFEFFINLYLDIDSFDKVSKPFLEEYFGKLKFLQDV